MKTIILHLAAVPGDGKTTFALNFVNFLKTVKNKTAVFISEEGTDFYARYGRRPKQLDEFVLFGNQCNKIIPFIGKYDFIVCEGSMFMTSFYASLYENDSFAKLFQDMWQQWNIQCDSNTFNCVLLLSKPVKNAEEEIWKYETTGRYQSEEETTQLRKKLSDFISSKKCECEWFSVENVHASKHAMVFEDLYKYFKTKYLLN